VLPLLASLHSLQRHLVVTHPAVKPANPRNRQVALLQALRALLPMGVVNHVSLQDHRMVLPQARLPPPMRLRGPPAPHCRQLCQGIGVPTSARFYPGVIFGAVKTTSSSITLCHPNAGGSTGACSGGVFPLSNTKTVRTERSANFSVAVNCSYRSDV
jgi:hypothetical protein